MIVQLQIDDSMVEAARLVGEALSKSGHAAHAIDPDHVLHDAIAIGLHQLMLTWLKPGTPFFESYKLPVAGRFVHDGS